MTEILCIDDEAALRKYICGELEEEGYGVIQASNGEEGLAMILKHKPDLILADINMPHKNGYQLLQELRTKYPQFGDIPFIFISALSDKTMVLDGLKIGADAYLAKPIDFELLLATVQASLAQMARIKHKQENVVMID